MKTYSGSADINPARLPADEPVSMLVSPFKLDRGETEDPGLPDDMLWHAGWAIGLVAGGAFLLMAVGAVTAQVLLSLTLMAIPGIIGALWRPKAEERFALMVLWALGAGLAVCATGGLSGPLAVFCVTPAAVCLVIGGSWRAGAGLSMASALFVALAGVLRIPPAPPAEPTRTWLTLIALVVAAGAAGGALLVARRRAELLHETSEAELHAFQSLMGDLPELALAMDSQGRTEAVFGQPLEGLNAEALHIGLIEVAIAADRAKLQAAIQEALDHGAAQATFTATEAADLKIAATFQRTSAGGLTAILRRAPTPMRVAGPIAAPAVAEPSLAARLSAAEAGRRDAEVGRDKAEAVATARARFLANMSHELRTPLNAIMGFSDMMRAKMFGELSPKYAEYADLIHESGGHLLDLINDVLDMSKIEAQRYTLSREVFDVREALNAALRLMRLQADDAEVKLRAVLPPAPLMIDADKRAIKQIALNLLSNALKFTPKGGTVILTAQAVVNGNTPGLLELIIADTGVGIAEEDLKRLGQPFEQAGGAQDRARGSGLGLSLVEAFAKLHGGALTLESRLGEGTAATVRMPVLLATEPEALEAEASQADAPREASVQAEPVKPESVEAPLVHPRPAPAETSVIGEPPAEHPTPAAAVTLSGQTPSPPPPPAVSSLNDNSPAEAPIEARAAETPATEPAAPEAAVAEAAPTEALVDQHSAEGASTPAEHAEPLHIPSAIAAAPVVEITSDPADHPRAEISAAEPPRPTPSVAAVLAQLDSRTLEHHGLKQIMLNIFRGQEAETTEPPQAPHPEGAPPHKPGNSAIQIID